MVKLKICGLTLAPQISAFIELNVNYLGFIFYTQSPRYIVGKCPAQQLNKLNFYTSKKIGVFVNEKIETVYKFYNEYALDLVQLHGHESPAYCENLFKKGVLIIKVFSINFEETILSFNFKDYEPFCEFYLFDYKDNSNIGGTGKMFNWNILLNLKINKPYFLSGGIHPYINIQNQIYKPLKNKIPYCLDINSQFEWCQGVKNSYKIVQFLNQLKSQYC